MNVNVRGMVLAAAAITVLAGPSAADDWPQWRGPKRTGVSAETGLLKEWPEGGPKLLWQAKDIGFGYSTPAVVGGHLYLLSNKGVEDEFVRALSVKDGKEVWSQRIGKVGNPNQVPPYPGARSTPTVEGDLLYALGSDGDLACLERETGKVRWQKNLRTALGGKPGIWAYSESPLIDGDVVVCTPGGKEATLAALKKSNGEVIWRCPMAEGDDAAYASVIVVEAGGVKQYVQLLQKGVVGVDARTGKLLWRYKEIVGRSPANIPTPVAGGRSDEYVYAATGMGGGGLVKLKKHAAGITAEPVYHRIKDLPNSIGGAVVLGDYLYGTNQAGLMCVELASGAIKWQNRCVGAGSVCAADGRLYIHGEKGAVALVEATPQEYREKGRFQPPDQPNRGNSQAWAYPVVANGRLYLRDLNCLWCYDVKEGGAGR